MSLQALLASHDVTLLEHGGTAHDLDGMRGTWERLWREFGAYTEIRDHLVSAFDRDLPFTPSNAVSAELLAYLLEVGLLTELGATYHFNGPRAGQRLRGSWLEELGATVARLAGADEVRFSQKLSWHAPHDRQVHFNEVDVIARFGGRLAFVSCKALAPWATTAGGGPQRIAEAIKEVARWRKVFGAGMGHAILLTTADFVDEVRQQLRNPDLNARAARLDVSLVTADAGDFDGLSRAFRRAVAAPG